MKSKVKLSLFSSAITAIVIVSLAAGVVVKWNGDKNESLILLAVLVGLLAVSLYYAPQSIEATDKSLIIHRTFKDKAFAYSTIKSVERCMPSIGGLRLCGSGGFFGYWGYFTDIVIGNYFGYYGNRNQCILVKLTDGKQYVISCEQPDEMIYTVSAQLKQPS